MIRKGAALIAFGVGCYYGHLFTTDMMTKYASDFEGYWGNTVLQFLRVLMPLGIGVGAGVAVYFLLNLFARAD